MYSVTKMFNLLNNSNSNLTRNSYSGSDSFERISFSNEMINNETLLLSLCVRHNKSNFGLIGALLPPFEEGNLERCKSIFYNIYDGTLYDGNETTKPGRAAQEGEIIQILFDARNCQIVFKIDGLKSIIIDNVNSMMIPTFVSNKDDAISVVVVNGLVF